MRGVDVASSGHMTTRRAVLGAIAGAAAIPLGGWVTVPLEPVPLTLQFVHSHRW